MVHTWTIVFFVAAAALMLLVARRGFARETVAVRLRLDRCAPGAHLMWDISNIGRAPITVQKLVLHLGRGPSNAETVPLRVPQVLQPREHALIPTDVDRRSSRPRPLPSAMQRGASTACRRSS